MAFHRCCIAAGFVVSTVLVRAKELVTAAVYLHLAYMGAGSALGGRRIAAAIRMDHSTILVGLGTITGNFGSTLTVTAVAMDMVAVPLHRDTTTLHGTFVSAGIFAVLAADMQALHNGIAILAMYMGAGRSRTAFGIVALRRMYRVMLAEVIRFGGKCR